MTITAISILERVSRELNDRTNIRWTVPELCVYFNDGQRDIVAHRPDAANVRTSMALTQGFLQDLPAGGEKLISVNNNTGGTRGAVTLVSRAILDVQIRNWRNLAGSNDILHYCYDVRRPKVFEVYPPAGNAASLDIEYLAPPQNITVPAEGAALSTVTGNLGLSDLFANPMTNYILYRCYRKDTEYTANPDRAAAYYQAYGNDLGVEFKATADFAPTPLSK